jgi:uncharacterized membrane protein YbhN (UPF0104 family)
MQPESASENPSQKKPLWQRLLPIVGGLAVAAVLFGWVLPQFIDYEAVFRAIGEIDTTEWVILLAVAILRFIPEGWIYVAAQPGLSTRQGVLLFVVAETLSNVPPGGLDLVSRFQMTRSWGFPVSEATSATIASWVFASLSKLALPIVAVLLLALRHVKDDTLDLIAVVSFAAVIGGTVLVILVLRSERLAGGVGRLLGSTIRFAARLFRKDVRTDFGSLVLEFRDQASSVLRARTLLGLGAGLAARIASFVVLLLAVRFVGIGAETVHWTVVFAVFAIVMAITVIPIFNLPGITEIILIGALNAVAQDSTDQVAAAVFVYRILTWLAPIPFGGLAFNSWRRQVQSSGEQDLLDAFDSPGQG